MVSNEFWYMRERSEQDSNFGIYLTVPGFYGRYLGMVIQVRAIESVEEKFWVNASKAYFQLGESTTQIG